MIAAEDAIRTWANMRTALVGAGRPLANGVHLSPPIRSPAQGAWALASRVGAGPGGVAEDGAVSVARIQFDVYSLDEIAAEKAAAAIATEIETLTGAPQAAGQVLILVHDNLSGPVFVPQPADSGEPFCFQVQADFMLTAQ
jgi:hypothetical protein